MIDGRYYSYIKNCQRDEGKAFMENIYNEAKEKPAYKAGERKSSRLISRMQALAIYDLKYQNDEQPWRIRRPRPARLPPGYQSRTLPTST
jgi:hypothetical protein